MRLKERQTLGASRRCTGRPEVRGPRRCSWCLLLLGALVAGGGGAWAGAGAQAVGALASGDPAPVRGSGTPATEVLAPAAGGASPAVTLSAGGMLLRVALGLALVLGLLGGVLVLYRKATCGRPGLRGDAAIEVVSQRSLGQRTSLAVVRVGGEVLLVGITQQQVNTLAHLGGLAQEARAPAAQLASATPSQPRASEFQTALEGEVQRVKEGLWASVRRLEASAK